ncbi:hypothetical protein MRX96_055714 [Rhipicephalus microplus]
MFELPTQWIADLPHRFSALLAKKEVVVAVYTPLRCNYLLPRKRLSFPFSLASSAQQWIARFADRLPPERRRPKSRTIRACEARSAQTYRFPGINWIKVSPTSSRGGGREEKQPPVWVGGRPPKWFRKGSGAPTRAFRGHLRSVPLLGLICLAADMTRA